MDTGDKAEGLGVRMKINDWRKTTIIKINEFAIEAEG